MKKHSFGSLLFIGLVLIIMYLPIAVVVVYSFNANTARIPIDFTGWTTDWYAKLFEGRSGFGDALTVRLGWTYRGLKFVPLTPPLRLGSVLVWKKQQVISPAVSALIAHAKKYIDSISDNTI